MISRDDYARSSRTAPNPRPHFASHFELDHINPHVTKPVWMVHNHPSGNPEPSAADIALTQRVRQALGLLDIAVLDHLIVAQGQSVSLAQRGLLG